MLKKKMWLINMILLVCSLKHKYDPWFQNEELADTTINIDKEESVDLSYISPLEGDEEVKEENVLQEKEKNLDFKLTINQASSIINTNKSWKQLI